MKIPVDKIFEYVKKNMGKRKENEEEYRKELNEQFAIMEQCKWEDIESLTKEELEKIQPGWLYDWARVTGEYQEKVTELFKKHNLSTLTPLAYLNKFDRKPFYDDVHKILPHYELKSYINEFLIDNKDFINDVDTCMWELSSDNKLINKSIKERREYFDNTIGNESRTYILKILTLKHLSNVLLKNINGFTDEFWRDRLNQLYEKEEREKQYIKRIKMLLSNKFPDKSIDEILRMPIETILENKTNEEFELSKNNITDIITKKHNENMQSKQQEQTETYNKPTNEEKLQKINELVSQDKISILTLQRLFYISFPKAASIIDNLVENEIIERLEKGYKILDYKKLQKFLLEKLVN